MKDMYTFDASIDEAKQSYEEVQSAYKRIMDRLFNSDDQGEVQQQNWRIAQADSGAMGGILSHEYHVEDPGE
jgi:prolyl-tRNA synthetase